ncbi:MAG TPA: chromosomal replication initiator protein DnaA [Desulfomicrobiaceae bacterium]|nr:chromosomal replication initiator protein DnaA [Desulfomicrobiaceae bacterium]
MRDDWEKIQHILQKTVKAGLYQVWIKPLTGALRGDTLVLKAPNAFVASWVRDRLQKPILEAAADVLGTTPELEVSSGARVQEGARKSHLQSQVEEQSGRLREDDPGSAPAEPSSSRLILPGRQGVAPNRSRGRQMGLPLRSDPQTIPSNTWRHDFEDFVVGPSNELAFVASRGFSQEMFASDQLFLSSAPGLGKTHLIQAIGKEVAKASNRSTVNIAYLTAEEFANQMVMAIKSRDIESFKARYREKVDVLLLEDIHFFQGKEKMQDELLNTIKSLQVHGRKVVFTSSFLPKELKDVDSNLTSRFCQGFLAQIANPDFETRVKIVEAKANSFQVALPRNVGELLAERIQTDVRQLESCLKNMILKARLMREELTVDMAWEMLKNYDLQDPKIDMAKIVQFVCKAYAFSEDQLRSKSRKKQNVIARNTAFFLARKHTELSLAEIGRRFNRRHSTVIKGIANVEREMNRQTPVGMQISQTIDRLSV